jgi:hypothetical protein
MYVSTATLKPSCGSINYELRLIRRNVDASKNIVVAKEILLFDFELFIGG